MSPSGVGSRYATNVYKDWSSRFGIALYGCHIAQILIGLPVVFLLVHFVPYFIDTHRLYSLPGPWLAKYSDAWLARISSMGHRSEVVHDLHMQYGDFVRIAPNHVSISNPAALPVVYGHGNGAIKSNFYDAFVSIARGLFNTRDRAQHSRKRKIVSHIFSPKSVVEFEPHVRQYVGQLIDQWDRLCEVSVYGKRGTEGDGGWYGSNGRLWLDCLPWLNYLAFDIIGDLAFGAPFGMLQKCADSAPVPISAKKAMNTYGEKGLQSTDVVYIPAAKILNDRGEFSMSLGVMPPWWRPIVVRTIPWFRKGSKAVANLAGISIAAVSTRLNTPTDRVDLLSKLQAGKDEAGKPMGKDELTAESQTQLIAGSDTTSNTSCAVIYWLAKNPKVQEKLQAELDRELGVEDETVSTADQVKRLPYLEAVLNEGMRIHSTSALGLPRVVPEGGLTVLDHYFPEGTVLSVPTYTIHRNTDIWGADVEDFRPERWFERDATELAKGFNPFSYGPRACVGRNLAFLELQIIISSLLRRYQFVLEEPEADLETREGFLRKPVKCNVGLKRRELI